MDLLNDTIHAPLIYASRSDRDPRVGRPPSAQRLAYGMWVDLDGDFLPWQQQRQVTLARARAAVHLTPSTRALSHEAAAILHGYPCMNQQPSIHLIVRGTGMNRRHYFPALASTTGEAGASVRPADLIRSRRRLSEDDIEIIQGLPVTSPLRTGVDCACDLPVRQSVVILDAIMAAQCQPDPFTRSFRGEDPEVVRHQLRTKLAEEPGRRGIRRARTAIALANPWSASPGESQLRWACAVANTPPPTPQHPVFAAGFGQCFLDLAWPKQRVGFEFDGMLKYENTSAFTEEKRRESALTRLGWTIERFIWDDLRDLDQLVHRIFSDVKVHVSDASAEDPLSYLLR